MGQKIKYWKIISVVFLLLFFFGIRLGEAADLFFSQPNQNYSVGQVLAISVYLNAEQAVNAISAEINFSNDQLEVLSLSKASSIVNFWTEEPSFFNSAGLINLEGVIFNPGFLGNNGKIITINFKAKDRGQAQITFSSASVLANDGLGTNVLKSANFINFDIIEPKPVVVKEKVVGEEMPNQASYLIVKEIKREDLTEPRVQFNIKAFDGYNFISKFEIRIDANEPIIWQDDGSHIYRTEPLEPAQHILLVKALSNKTESLVNSVEFTIQPLETPKIIDYPSKLYPNSHLILKGLAQDSSRVIVYLQRPNEPAKSQEVLVKEDGEFTYVSEEKLTASIYKIQAQSLDEREAKSLLTDPILIQVEPSLIIKIGSWTVDMLKMLITFVALILLLISLIWYGYLKIRHWRLAVKKESQEANQVLAKYFTDLKGKIDAQLHILAKSERSLTEEEYQTLKDLKNSLSKAEKSIRKEIKDIDLE